MSTNQLSKVLAFHLAKITYLSLLLQNTYVFSVLILGHIKQDTRQNTMLLYLKHYWKDHFICENMDLFQHTISSQLPLHCMLYIKKIRHCIFYKQVIIAKDELSLVLGNVRWRLLNHTAVLHK